MGRHERGDVVLTPDAILVYADAYGRPDLVLRYCAECPVGKRLGRKATDRDLHEASLRLQCNLGKATAIAHKLAEIAYDGIIDDMERPVFDSLVGDLRVMEETIADLLLLDMTNGTKRSRPVATEATSDQRFHRHSTIAKGACQTSAVRTGGR